MYSPLEFKINFMCKETKHLLIQYKHRYLMLTLLKRQTNYERS